MRGDRLGSRCRHSLPVMPRFRLALLLPLLLVLAQHGAVLHQLSHVAYTTQAVGAQLGASDSLLDDGPCLSCEAFAQVTHPGGAAHATAVPLADPLLIAPEPRRFTVEAAAIDPRSRGPPQLAS